MSGDGEEPEILFEKRGRAGLVTLNRPQALNALTLSMVRAFYPQLMEWAQDDAVGHVVVRAAGDKAFCAGGDIRALYDWGQARDPSFLAFYREEYQLNTYIKRYPKPYVALIDGIDMGGGVGISVHGSHRVAGDRLNFAMPETGIGLFPDVGGTYFLPRLPGETGMYLALTGSRLKAGDAVLAGFATHYVPSERFADLEEALCKTDDVDEAIAGFASDPGFAPLGQVQGEIDRHFAGGSVAAILESLDADQGEWATKQATTMRMKSPLSQRLTYRQMREGAKLEFEDCMGLEYRLVNRIFEGHDFYEGIRAVVIEKDHEPNWQPATLDEVTDDMVDAYFAPLEDELPLDDIGKRPLR